MACDLPPLSALIVMAQENLRWVEVDLEDLSLVLEAARTCILDGQRMASNALEKEKLLSRVCRVRAAHFAAKNSPIVV